MKRLLAILMITTGFVSYGQHQASVPNIYDMGLRKGWDDGSRGYVIKLLDLTYRYSFNSKYAHNAEGLFYPITALRMDPFPIDLGVGGGVSFADQASYGYAKLFLGRDILSSSGNYYSSAFYRLGVGSYVDFMFGNGSQRIGFDLINTFPISYSYKARILVGTSYHTEEQAWKLNLGVSFGFEDYFEPVRVKKPVVYAYAEDTISTSVSFDFDGPLTFVYPTYEDAWNITVLPNDMIIDNANGKIYPYLFWEGDYQLSMIPTFDEGFVVSNTEMITFLEHKLSLIGLNDKEKTDFITFWGPQLNEEQYIVKFIQQADCDGIATYEFSTEPDNFLRLYVTFEPAAGAIHLPEQQLTPIDRGGFTLVEWGGMILPSATASH
jgi:hypothetical protein